MSKKIKSELQIVERGLIDSDDLYDWRSSISILKVIDKEKIRIFDNLIECIIASTGCYAAGMKLTLYRFHFKNDIDLDEYKSFSSARKLKSYILNDHIKDIKKLEIFNIFAFENIKLTYKQISEQFNDILKSKENLLKNRIFRSF